MSIWPSQRTYRDVITLVVLVVFFRAVSNGASAPTITSLSPESGPAGTTVTISGTNFGTDLLVGKIGWWGPFVSGVAPNNLIPGRPNGRFVGSPTFTSDGGGAFRSTASNYLEIPDGGAGGTYDWTSGAWSTQVDFALPATPAWGSIDHFLLASKGSFNKGTGWEVQITNTVFQGKYQIMLESNHGVNSYHLISSYLVVPGAFNRALFICDTTGKGTWYVNGASGNAQTCAPTASGATNLVVGRYSDQPDYASNFPITRLQIWNRALTPVEATLSTTTDPTPRTVTFNGTAATPTNWSLTTITVPVPVGTTTGPVVVSVGGQASNGMTFTVSPSITGLSPTSGGAASTVTISGANFGATQGTSTVTFNGTVATPTSWSATSIQAAVPAKATTGHVVVTVGGYASHGVGFTVTSPPPPGTTGDLPKGKIGWWGPFEAGVEPSNKVAGMPNGSFVGMPTFTNDGGGAFTSDATNYLNVPDGGVGGRYDWTSGPWSAQVDFAFPGAPIFPSGPFLLVSKGSFARGTGWEIQVNDTTFQGKYQIQAVSNHGLDSHHLNSSFLVVPGAFNRALFVCDATGVGTWHVNGTAGTPQSCAPTAGGDTNLVIGRYSDQPAYASGFPIARLQIWNRALTPAEATVSTTTDPPGNVPRTSDVGTFNLLGAISPASDGTGATVTLGGAATAATTANASGSYSFGGLANETYAVIPSKAGYTFTPASRIVTVNGSDVTAVDFTAVTEPTTYTVSGTLTPAAAAGSTVTLNGTGPTITADSFGRFALRGLVNGTYTVTPSKSGYVFEPASQTVTVNGTDVTTVDFTAAMGPTTERANSYDNGWKTEWVARARSILATPGKTNGFVIHIGDSMTHSPAYAAWPILVQGQTSEDAHATTWAQATSWGADNVDATNKNGWYLATANITAQRGMTSSSGLSAGELVSGCCNGGPTMPANVNLATSRLILTDGAYSGNLQIDTIMTAFSDAQFAVVMLGTDDPTNPNNVAELTAIVDRLEAQHIVPILTTIPPRNDAFSNSLNIQFNTAVTTLAQTRSLPLIDLYQEILLRRPGTTWMGTLIAADGVSLTASGGGFVSDSNPYGDGGDATTSTTGGALANVGYLLRSWLTVQKLKEAKQYVIEGINP